MFDLAEENKKIADRLYMRYHGVSAKELREAGDREKQKAELEKLQFAREFLRMGISVRKVAQALCLPLEQVQDLKTELE